MINKEDLAIYDKVLTRCREVAYKWIKGWGPLCGYSGPSDFYIDLFHTKTFSFSANPTVHGFSPRITLPIEYLFDDTDIEKESEKEYQTYKKEIEIYNDYIKKCNENKPQYPKSNKVPTQSLTDYFPFQWHK